MVNSKVGLEVHGYLTTKEKLFCRCKNLHNKKHTTPNTFICPVCTGQPGSKPMLPNEQAIKKIIQVSLMLGCKINSKLIWQRKHYNWPDLPKGYQNTLSGPHAIPVGVNGKFLGIRIRECHLEEDPAAWNPEKGTLDYNRSGAPLVEIVTEPDFTSAEQVSSWLKQLVLTLSYTKSLDREAGIKSDVNVSLYGERIEIKNVNSIAEIEKAIKYEVIRQEKEKPIKKETRAWSAESGKTIKMREKEEHADYRFISDPDLPVIKITEKQVSEIKEKLPESPQEKLKRIIKTHKISKKQAEVLTSNIELVEFFEKITEKITANFALDWVTIELLRVLNYNKKRLDDENIDIKVEHFTELLELVKKGTLTELKAKQILNKFVPKSFSPSKEAKKSERITNKKELEEIIEKILANKENKKPVEDYKSGQKNALNFLIGEVMKESEKRADFKLSLEILKQKLK